MLLQISRFVCRVLGLAVGIFLCCDYKSLCLGISVIRLIAFEDDAYAYRSGFRKIFFVFTILFTCTSFNAFLLHIWRHVSGKCDQHIGRTFACCTFYLSNIPLLCFVYIPLSKGIDRLTYDVHQFSELPFIRPFHFFFVFEKKKSWKKGNVPVSKHQLW